MTEPYIFHPLVSDHVQRFLRQPTHALLISGPAGSGKDTLVQVLGSQLVGVDNPAGFAQYAYLTRLAPDKDKSSIGIEAVRELQHAVKLRLPADAPYRVIHITQAEALTTEAQNSLLKLLEEPPEATVIILTATTEQSLLPTIRSRLQHMQLLRPARQALIEHFQQLGHDSQAIGQAYLLSGGLPGLMHALLAQSDHPLRLAVQQAKDLLRMNQFERLCMVDSLAKDKTAALQVLFVLQQMAGAAIEQSAAKASASADNGHKALRQWHRVLKAASQAEQGYTVSAQAKLNLTHLMLSL